MENLEIVFKHILVTEMSYFLLEVLKIDEKNIISSHFWDSEKELDLSFQKISNIDRYFANGGWLVIIIFILRKRRKRE